MRIYTKLLNPKMMKQMINEPKKILIILIFILAAVFIKEFIGTNESLEAKVIKVIDGDTINVLENKQVLKIRLFGIDAPESKQEFGKESTDFLASMIMDKNIRIIYKDKDQYGRIIGIVEFDGKDINKIMVSSGYAWAYTYYSDIYAKDQILAKEKKLGLWKSENPLEPHKWRKQNRF